MSKIILSQRERPEGYSNASLTNEQLSRSRHLKLPRRRAGRTPTEDGSPNWNVHLIRCKHRRQCKLHQSTSRSWFSTRVELGRILTSHVVPMYPYCFLRARKCDHVCLPLCEGVKTWCVKSSLLLLYQAFGRQWKKVRTLAYKILFMHPSTYTRPLFHFQVCSFVVFGNYRDVIRIWPPTKEIEVTIHQGRISDWLLSDFSAIEWLATKSNLSFWLFYWYFDYIYWLMTTILVEVLSQKYAPALHNSPCVPYSTKKNKRFSKNVWMQFLLLGNRLGEHFV